MKGEGRRRVKAIWTVLGLLVLGAWLSLGQGAIPPNPKVVGEPVIVEPGKPGGQLRLAEENPGTLNPYVSFAPMVFKLMHAGLLEVNPISYALEAAVAESIQFEPDGKALRLVLRDIKFSDGTPLTADDVLFTINDVLLNLDITSDELAYLRRALTPEGTLILQGAEKLDGRTVRLLLTQPHIPLLKLLHEIKILPRHKLADKVKRLNPKAAPDAFVKAWGLDAKPEEIAGLGPFRLKEIRKTGIPFISEERVVVLERNPFYWKVDKNKVQLPYVDILSIALVNNPLAGAAKLKAGELDYAFLFSDFLPLQMVQRFKDLAKEVGFQAVYLGSSFRTVFLTFNQDTKDEALRKLFRDVRFRQAAAHLLDREQIIQKALQGFGVARETLLSPLSPFFAPEANRRFEPSLSKAQALLDELGLKDTNQDGVRELPNGRPLQIELLVHHDDEGRLNTAKLLADSFLKAGIRLTVKPVAAEVARKRIVEEPDFQAAIVAFTIVPGPAIFPEDFFSLFFSRGRNHFYKRSDAEDKDVAEYQRRLDQILRQQATELDPERRRALFVEMQKLVSENLPVIWLYSPALLAGARPTLGNTAAITTPDAVLELLETLWRKD